MCRIAGFLGVPIPLSDVLSTPPHSLRHQGSHPRELPAGLLGADGYGFAWLAEPDTEAACYRSVVAIWSDPNLESLAPHVRAGCFVASTRTAEQNMPLAFTNTPPFCSGRTMLVHNGTSERFHDGLIDAMRAALTTEARRDILGNTDSEYLAALLRDARGETLEARVRATLAQAAGLVRRAGTKAQLNLIVGDGRQLVAARFAVGKPAPSLYFSTREGVGVFVASEPLSEHEPWTRMPESALLVVTRGAGSAVQATQHVLGDLSD